MRKGKSHKGLYWKHSNCMDAFISIRKVAFDDDGKNAILDVSWCAQGTSSWWFCPVPVQRIKVTPEHYGKWCLYSPHVRGAGQ